jgi:predicted dehydrogenase
MTFTTIIAGARSVRQGTGPFLAAAMAHAGATVAGVVGTSEQSARAAQDTLEQDWGLLVNPYDSITAAVSAEDADVVVVCTPWQFHREHLREVVAAGCHCLAEKPLLWPASEREVGELVRAFQQRGLLLQMVAQWPFSLQEFSQLHGPLSSSIDNFTMRLSPISIGPHMIPDAAPHFISLLQALVGTGDCEEVKFLSKNPDELTLKCRYRHPGGSVQASLELKTVIARPRPAWIEINGLRAERSVELPEYRQFFTADGRQVELSDPMQAVAENFLANLGAEKSTDAAMLSAGHRNLLQLDQAWPA